VLGKIRFSLVRMLLVLMRTRKSQIAIEYAHRIRKASPETSVFWVNADSIPRFIESYRKITVAAKLPGVDEPKYDVLGAVSSWLARSESGKWHLMLDNADYKDIFFAQRPKHDFERTGATSSSSYLSQYLPQTQNASLLISSRDRATAFSLTGNQAQVMPISVISEDDIAVLLSKKLPQDTSDDAVKRELIVELDCMPLAITQAAAFITRRSPRMTVTGYTKLLRQSEVNEYSLLSEHEEDLRRDPSVSNSVLWTWRISFDYIR